MKTLFDRCVKSPPRRRLSSKATGNGWPFWSTAHRRAMAAGLPIALCPRRSRDACGSRDESLPFSLPTAVFWSALLFRKPAEAPSTAFPPILRPSGGLSSGHYRICAEKERSLLVFTHPILDDSRRVMLTVSAVLTLDWPDRPGRNIPFQPAGGIPRTGPY